MNPAEQSALEVLKGKDPGPLPAIVKLQGKVVSMQTGPPLSATITLGASAVQVTGVRYLKNGYTPVANDIVEIEKTGDDLLIIGVRA